MNPWEHFKKVAFLEKLEKPPIAFIVDSPWLPKYWGVDTLDFFLHPDNWFDAYRSLLDKWPEITWVPGFWFEYGMALEPSAYGVKMLWHKEYPPSLESMIDDPHYWADVPVPNVKEAGLLPFALRSYEYAEKRLNAEGLKVNLLCSRGPLVTANWLMGAESLMLSMVNNPKELHKFLDNITTFIIRWLKAQMEAVSDPEGFMIMDDLVGMISVEHYYEFALPYLNRIFDEFEGMLRIYHNDTRCSHLDKALTDCHFEVYQLSYQTDLVKTKEIMGHHCAVMGNIPPLQVGLREKPEMIYRVTQHYLNKVAPGGSLILSTGGGISAGTPVENVEAMVQAWRDWDPNNITVETDPEVLQYFAMDIGEVTDHSVGRKSRRRRRRTQ
ncbi:MAG: uroporphyrinogen decarboxylase [Chloroflexi bacterium]|nr:MAG: uroporphyrinogen decarboxylase [Chloroflexota bacterium]